MSDQDTVVATVRTLLTAAGLDVPDDDVQALARMYPGLRRRADRMYDIEVGDEVPAPMFRADEGRPV